MFEMTAYYALILKHAQIATGDAVTKTLVMAHIVSITLPVLRKPVKFSPFQCLNGFKYWYCNIVGIVIQTCLAAISLLNNPP